MAREKIGRNTTIHFGKHKGERLRDIPTGYLEWYRDNGEFDDWVDAAFEELKHRKKATDERPADRAEPEPQEPEAEEPEAEEPDTSISGKRYLDSIIIAFEYTLLALTDLGHAPAPDAAAIERGAWVQALVEASQKIAVTAAIQADKMGLDLEAELRPLVSEKWAKKNPKPKVKGQDADMPF